MFEKFLKKQENKQEKLQEKLQEKQEIAKDEKEKLTNQELEQIVGGVRPTKNDADKEERSGAISLAV